jgi:endonuclease G
VKRTNRFIPDPAIQTGSASNKDYQSSGYDRGHLAPSADMCFSKETMLESFYLSNMSPQKPGFNRGIWKDLETLVRVWAEEDSSIYIVTGGILTPGLPAIGANKVSIPTLFYKVILDYREPVVKGIGIVIPNDKSDRPLSSYAISIDSVESLTGLNFFCRLPDDIEYKIEVSADTTQWIWHPGAARQQKGDED